VNVLLVPAHPGFPGQIPQSRKTVVLCVCICCENKYVVESCEAAATIAPSAGISQMIADDLDTLHSVLKYRNVNHHACIQESLFDFSVTLSRTNISCSSVWS